MKIIFDKNTLLDILAPAMSAVSNKKENPVTECVRLKTMGDDKCLISAFDGERGFQAEAKCRVLREGCYLINASKLISIARSMPMDITIDVSESMLATITSGRSRFEIQCLSGKSFPNTPVLEGDYAFVIKQGQLKRMINQTAFACAENNQKLQLNGAYFVIKEESIKIVALDGFRFAQRYEECKLKNLNADGSFIDIKFILMKKALLELTRLLSDGDEEIKVVRGLKHIMFMKEDYIFYTRQIDGDYIDYERFIPKGCPIEATIRGELLAQALERALLVTEEREDGKIKGFIKLRFEASAIKMTSVSTSNKIYEEIPAQKTGDDIEIGFNCKWLLEIMKAVSDSEYVTLSLTSPLSCMSIRASEDDGGFMYFVYPVRLRENN